jgi:hypothetical protein
MTLPAWRQGSIGFQSPKLGPAKWRHSYGTDFGKQEQSHRAGSFSSPETCQSRSKRSSGLLTSRPRRTCSPRMWWAPPGSRSRAGTSWPRVTASATRAATLCGETDGRHHLRGRQQPRTDAVQSQACDRRDPYRRKRLTSAIFTQQGVELKTTCVTLWRDAAKVGTPSSAGSIISAFRRSVATWV